MHSLTIFLSVLAFLSTFIGGFFSIKFKDKLHYIMALTAGILLGVVAFDLLPEIIELTNENNFNSNHTMIALVTGFLLFHIFEKTILIHHAHEESYAKHKHPNVGVASAIGLISHSFMDGLGIGLGFQLSNSVGLIVAIAVIAHNFTDGINTVTLMLSNKNTVKKAKLFLFFDALAPVLGIIVASFFQVSERFLVLYLGFFAGFLLYIGAADILPEAHSEKSSFKLIGLTVLGVLLMYFIIQFAHF